MKYDYNALMKEIYEEVRALGIPVSGNIEPEVQINTRAKKRYGRCMRLHGEKYEYRIEVSAYLEDKDENCVRSVLAHELLHTCPRCMNHKLLWKTYAGKMNNAYSYCITATTEEARGETGEIYAAMYKMQKAVSAHETHGSGAASGAVPLRLRRQDHSSVLMTIQVN